MILALSDITKLKKEIGDRFSAQIHFHDGCGGQYFSLDERNDEIQKYITAYFADMNVQAVFSEDGLRFTVRKEKTC